MSPVVLVCGTFDHFHEGHRALVREALTHGDVTVLVAQDATVRAMKGFSPDGSLEERMQHIVQAFPSVRVVAGHPTDMMASVREIKPDLLLLGYDQKLPPPLSLEDLRHLRVLRAEAYFPERYKSSLLRKGKKSGTMS
jgi:FAD synthetase